ncbi:hypothetical protein [Streptomyces sp. NPDC048516]|uniref:hypothetical protein n=1 Tax=Streptomyces sp. NPDC048516 TaxID=3365565 RepID=UPI0037185179
MIEHFETLAAGFTMQGKLLGTVGSGGLATVLTGVMIAGIREPKGGGEGGGKKGKMRRKLTSTQAQVLGIAAGTCYAGAGSIWTASGQMSNAFAEIFTSGAFGAAGTGAVSLLLAGWMYFREMRPAWAAGTGVIAAGVWASAGGIWGLPEAVVLTVAHSVAS